MAQIFPFRPFRYTSKAGAAQKLVTQPYDKISPAMQEDYYAASPYNVVRLILGKTEPGDDGGSNVYTRAASTLENWIDEGVLAQDEEPGLFPYFQEFRHPESGETYVRKGFTGLLRLEDYSAGVVHRHEMTHSGPKQDRLELLRHTNTHFGQIFLLYDDPEASVDPLLDEAAAAEPLVAAEDDSGVRHSVWKISGGDGIGRIQQVMSRAKLLIADGHHRYETALTFARENPGLPGADRVMATFVNLHAPGLAVLATHRVVFDLPEFRSADLLSSAEPFFGIRKMESIEELENRLGEPPAGRCEIGAVFHDDPAHYLLTARPEALDPVLGDLPEREKKLDVVVLHRALIEKGLSISEEAVRELRHIRYVRGLRVAADEVRDGKAQAAFLLRPVPPQQVAEAAFAGGVMPQKSTDFYPKLLAGLTMYRFG